MTREHVPAKGLFEKPRPSNLNTVPCCLACNNSYSKDDEYFRLVVSSLINVNTKGQSIWNNKVIDSTLRSGRIKTLIDEVNQKSLPITIHTEKGPKTVYNLSVDALIIDSVLIRLTKGLLFIAHPEIDRSGLEFSIAVIDQFKLHTLYESGVAGVYTEYGLGEGVYHLWRALSEDDVRYGAWVHLFYGAACFMVEHYPKGRVALSGIYDELKD